MNRSRSRLDRLHNTTLQSDSDRRRVFKELMCIGTSITETPVPETQFNYGCTRHRTSRRESSTQADK